MSSQQNLKWKTTGDDAAQLFRDFYFRRYHPEDYTPGDIHAATDREYAKYNKNNFKRNCQSVANRVLTYEQYGNGLSKTFKAKLRLEEPPASSDQEDCSTDEEEGPEPTSPAGEAKDLRSPEEKRLGVDYSNKQPTTIITTPQPVPAETVLPTPATKNTIALHSKKTALSLSTLGKKDMPKFQNKLGHTILKALPDGRVLGVAFLNRKYHPDKFKIRISEDGKQVICASKIPEGALSAKHIYRDCKFAADDQNLHVTALQAEIDQLTAEFPDKEMWEEVVLCETEFEVLRTFVDENGVPTNEVDFGCDENEGLQWIYFWLQGVHALKKKNASPIRIKSRAAETTSNLTPEDDSSYFMEETVTSESASQNLDERLRQMAATMQAQQQEQMMSLMQNLTTQFNEQFQRAHLHQQHQFQEQINQSWQQFNYAGAGGERPDLPTSNPSSQAGRPPVEEVVTVGGNCSL